MIPCDHTINTSLDIRKRIRFSSVPVSLPTSTPLTLYPAAAGDAAAVPGALLARGSGRVGLLYSLCILPLPVMLLLSRVPSWREAVGGWGYCTHSVSCRCR